MGCLPWPTQVSRTKKNHRQIAEAGHIISIVFVVCPRNCRSKLVARIFPRHDHQFFGSLHPRDGLEEEYIDHGKYRNVSTQTQRQSEHRDHSKCPVLAQHPHPITQVLFELGEPHKPTRLTRRFLDATSRSEPTVRFGLSFRLRHPRS